jgi:hypothetical protein
MKPTILSIAAVLIMGLSAFAGKANEFTGRTDAFSGKTNEITGTTSASAGKNDEINKLAVKAFSKDFRNATNISWEQKENYVRVTFTMNDQVMFAYYDNNGDLQAVVRNIVSDQLPINLLTQLKTEYSGFWISDLFEVASDDQTTYYVTLENADKKIVLNSVNAADWNVYSKFKKSVE